MSKTVEKFEVKAQLDRARGALGDALELAQNIDAERHNLDIDALAASLAKCLQAVFSLKKAGLATEESVMHVQSATNRLRETLGVLQDIHGIDPVLENATRQVALSLGLLYPVATLVEKLNGRAEPRKPGSRDPGPASVKSPAPVSAPAPQLAGDRRSAPRKQIKVDIGMHSETNFFAGFSQNISSGGLFVATYDILPVGSRLNVNFKLPGGPVMSLSGTVRWVREFNETAPEMTPGMGVEFDELSPADARLINRYMAVYPPMFYDD